MIIVKKYVIWYKNINSTIVILHVRKGDGF